MRKKRKKKRKFDKHQQRLKVDVKSGRDLVFPPLPEGFQKWLGDVLCPFCLHKDIPIKFGITTKKGYHRRLGKCRECGNQMLLSSLTTPMTPSQFAEWVWEYPHGQFWRKCAYDKFSSRLSRLGWSFEFWGKYFALKKGKKQIVYDEYTQYLESVERNDT